MSIQFKFRSSLNFDSVDIDGRDSISLRELRLKIVRLKNIKLCQDFDLIFFDSVSGEEYNDENLQIPSGSSVIVKRVPARMAPSATTPPIGTMKELGLKDADPINLASAQLDGVGDLRAAYCPVTEGPFLYSDVEFGNKNCWDFEKENNAGLRIQCQKLDSSDLSQAIRKGSNPRKSEANISPEPRIGDVAKLQKVVTSNFPAMHYSDLPAELKCSLCYAFFKEAVMIPCCQHSFCEKCIRLVLLEKARCPKCFSSKCKAEDLLPNLSLRQAIVHFLEAQIPESENALRKYAPDGESGIQVKYATCAVTVVQREPEMPHSPSATGKGSNQVMTESFYDSLTRKNTLSRTMQQANGGRGRYANHWHLLSGPAEAMGDCQGESRPLNALHTHVPDEGRDMNYLPAGRVRKDRNCYMCGCPDHLIRDCPFASNPNPMIQTGNHMLTGVFPGYASSYWNSNTYSTPRPFANMYSNAGIAPFNACMVPTAPFTPPYMHSMHGGFPLPGGIMRTGGMALPVGNRDDRLVNQYGFMALQLGEDRRKVQNENMGRGQYFQEESNFNEHHQNKDREASGKLHKERRPTSSSSEGSFSKKTQRKNLHVEKRREKSPRSSSSGRKKVLYHSDRSKAATGDFHNSSDRHRRESHQHPDWDSRKHHEKKGRSSSDSTRDHHKASDLKHRGDRRHVRVSHQKHPNHSSFAREPSSPVHQKAGIKERGSGHDPKHSRHQYHVRQSSDELRDNKRKMNTSSYEGCRDDYHYQKRKRVQ